MAQTCFWDSEVTQNRQTKFPSLKEFKAQKAIVFAKSRRKRGKKLENNVSSVLKKECIMYSLELIINKRVKHVQLCVVNWLLSQVCKYCQYFRNFSAKLTGNQRKNQATGVKVCVQLQLSGANCSQFQIKLNASLGFQIAPAFTSVEII
jgi:hypothetical protein